MTLKAAPLSVFKPMTVIGDKINALVSEKGGRLLKSKWPTIVKGANFVPFAIQKNLLPGVLQKLFSDLIEEGVFDYLEDHWVRIKINDAGLDWCFSLYQGRVVMAEQNLESDVTIEGQSKDFIFLASKKQDSDTLFFQRRIKVSGSTELGLEVKNSLDQIDLSMMPLPISQLIERLAVILH